ncbi:ATP-binding protein [Streptomyces sp. NRRL WC-3742]|uniref:ATP-binding protein n=1 Tax=Streptomyces sp. NRRL WC-3742 TaxID=1463934 RepID=UPI00068F43D0|nr:ATP-binding protein [Streptomyces sp. NRRL WC-3742]
MTPLNTPTAPVLCTLDIEAGVAAVPPARREVGQTVLALNLPLSNEALGDVELCVGELLANAVEHVGERCRVVVRWTGVRVRVEVADGSPLPPTRTSADDLASGGRGLLLVEALAHSWGWYPEEGEKVVWCEVAPGQGDQPRYEVRVIDSRSPHFVLLECWGIYDRERHDYLRVPGSSDRIRRFYTKAAAAAHLSREVGKCTT